MIPDVEFESAWDAVSETYQPVAVLTWPGGSLRIQHKERYAAVRLAMTAFDRMFRNAHPCLDGDCCDVCNPSPR